MRGHRLPISASTSGDVLERRRPERIADVAARLRIAPSELGVPEAHTALLVPMLARGEGIGVLAAFDRGDAGEVFTAEDELLLTTFAASAANAVAMRRSVESERLRSSLAAADAERSRWARELHDETLQGLGALRLLLAGARRRGDPRADGAHPRRGDRADRARDRGPARDHQRSAARDPRRARSAAHARGAAATPSRPRRARDHLRAVAARGPATGEKRLPPEIETTVYRLVQESLTNIVKHAKATKAHVTVTASPHGVDGGDRRQRRSASRRRPETSGFGLAGMRERVYLVGGTLTIESGDGGTSVRAELPTGLPGRRRQRRRQLAVVAPGATRGLT